MLALNASLFTTGERILVAVSGGVDSLALLHALASLRSELGVEVSAAHVHHGMRGEAADADVVFLSEQCRAWGVPLAVAYADVPALAAERRISVEEAGRDARHAAFEELAKEHGCGKVATAHHADDQAETVLLNLFRGAGIDGLAGMPERRPLSAAPGAPELIRPLLRVSRADLEAYCADHGLEPRFDVTNTDLAYRRNRVRRQLLPLLEEYDPAIVRHLIRLADQARDEQALLTREVDALLASALVIEPAVIWPIPLPALAPSTVLNTAPLRAAPPALLRRALRRALRGVAGYALELDALLVERLTEMVSGAGPTAFDLPGCALEARRNGERLHLRGTARLPTPEPVGVALPGITNAASFGLRLSIRETPIPENLRVPPAEAILDAGSLQPPLALRVAAVGERFQPLNAPGRCLLSDFFASRKIPAGFRAVWPVLADAEGPVWVLGLAIAHRVRVGPETERAIRLRVEPIGSITQST
ncbi:MAG: tRNA lysidine(34) synthetase TilS [Actinomycetota bacterium]